MQVTTYSFFSAPSVSPFPSQSESTPGSVDYEHVKKSLAETKQSRGKYIKFSEEDRFTIGRYENSKHVSISGSSDKRAITATFGITLNNSFLPMQLIYGGKTAQSLPKFEFPSSFSLSVNPSHFSNTKESISLIEDVIIPYVISQRKSLGVGEDQYALLILNVFSGQMTEPVKEKLKENRILFVCVPANMTKLFQPLDLTVNLSFKAMMKRKFTSSHCQKEEIIANGWKQARITSAVSKGLNGLESLDPFESIDPLADLQESVDQLDRLIDPEEQSYFVSARQENDEDDESDEEWVEKETGKEMRSIFDIFEEEE